MELNEEKMVNILQKQIKEIENLKNLKLDSSEFTKWKTLTTRILEEVFGKNSDKVKKFGDISYSLPIVIDDISQKKEIYVEALGIAKGILQASVEEIEFLGITKKVPITSKTQQQVFNMSQNQSVHLEVKNILENSLEDEQFTELKNILGESNKEKKEKNLKRFLEKIGFAATVGILKSLLMQQNWQL